jgi:peroxiredoxin
MENKMTKASHTKVLFMSALVSLLATLLLGCPKALPARQTNPPSSTQNAGEQQVSPVQPEFTQIIPQPGASLKIGSVFPPFVSSTLDGKPLDISTLYGDKTYVLVWFWASWTDLDTADLTALQQIFSAYEGERFHLVTVNIDLPSHEEKVSSIISSRTYGFPVIPDFHNEAGNSLALMNAYGTGPGKNPPNFLLGPGGMILLKNLKADELPSVLTPLMATNVMLQPLTIDLSVAERIEPTVSDEPVRIPNADGNVRTAPESLVLSISIDNPQALETDVYDVKVAYVPLRATGETTCLRVYPEEPSSDLITADGRPVVFHVVSGSYSEVGGRVEGATPSYMVDIPVPADTSVIEYYGQVWSFFLNRMVTGERDKEDFSGFPYCTTESVRRQGGLIAPPAPPSSQ